MIQFSIVENQATGLSNVVALDPSSDSPIKQADSNNPHWAEIVAGLYAGDTNVFALFDIKGGVANKMTRLSERISYDGENILFDGDVQSGPLADHLYRCITSGVKDYAPVVKFWEKVAQNPSESSREQMFTWLRSHDFTITDDGDILGYKGVRQLDDGRYVSLTGGEAFVDGKVVRGKIPNQPGTVVTMPRSKVNSNSNHPCSYGLHVGDWSYASNFGSVTLEVHVNPRDVVSIPSDDSARKMRCCRYKVVKVRNSASGAPIASENDEWTGDVGYAPE